MRILALNQFYPPDHAATAQLLGDLCEGLAAEGHDVSVITSRGTYLGGRSLPRRETLSRVAVLRSWATSLGKATLLHRLADYGSFWGSSLFDLVRVARPDVVLALTTPPMIASGVALVAAARHVPLVTWVQDVYPEAASQLGVLDEAAPAYRALLHLSAWTHRRSTRTVALSTGMARRLEAQGADAGRVRVIPNWADGSELAPLPREANPFRREHGLGDAFVAMYSGNLGMGHDVATLIQAARQLSTSCPRALLVFVGDGARRPEAEQMAAGLPNVRFLPYQPRERLAQSLSAADVHLVTLRPELEGFLVPSKLYGALASARPVCYVGPAGCEVAIVVKQHDLGWAGAPGDAAGLASAIGTLAGDTAHWSSMCRRARQVFSERYDRPVALRHWVGVLEEAVRTFGTGETPEPV